MTDAQDKPKRQITPERREQMRLNMIAYRKRVKQREKDITAELARLRALTGEKE